MKYLLDTNIIIDHIRGKIPIKKELLEGGVGINSIVLGELYYGVFKSVNPKKSLALIETVIQSLDLHSVVLTDEVMYEFGKIKATLEKEGRRVEDFDLLIAATAIVLDVTLVTNNRKHFERIEELSLYP